jgi:hypothetical protein
MSGVRDEKNTIAIFVLAGLLIVSFIINVDLLFKQSRNQTSQAEVSGAYDLFLSDLRNVQFSLEESIKSTDQDNKNLSMFKLIRMSDATYYDFQELNRKIYDTYGETLPLRDVLFIFSLDAYRLTGKKDNTSHLQTLKEKVDLLLNSINSTKITDKKTFENTNTKMNEYFKASSLH